MEGKSYPEIQLLEAIYLKHKVSISISDIDFLGGNKDFPALVFSLGNNSFQLYVNDEYGDLQIENPLLVFCLILRELENYIHQNDYLEWCKSQLLEPANSQVRAYHMDLRNIYKDVEKIIGEINSHISSFDFELNAGAAQALRKPI